MNFTNEELRRIIAILDAETKSFTELVRLAGLKPNRDFKGADLCDVNFADDDISEFDFSDADLRGADFTRARGLHRVILTQVKTDERTQGLDRIQQARASQSSVTTPEIKSKNKTTKIDRERDSTRNNLDDDNKNMNKYRGNKPKRQIKQRTKPVVDDAVIRNSVTDNYIICLEDGDKVKNLRKYIRRRYGMTALEYKERWDLPHNYPMVPRNERARPRGMKK